MNNRVRFFAFLAAAALAGYQIILAALIALRPDLDPSWHTVSEWAIGPWGWLMSFGFILSGVGYASLALALGPFLRSGAARAGLVLLAVCAIGAVGVGCFTTDPMGGAQAAPSATGLLHILFGTAQLMLLPWSALLVNLSLWRPSKEGKRDPWFLALGLAPLAGFLFFAAYTALFVAPLGDAHGPGVNIGWPPRVAFFCYAVWVVGTAMRVARVKAAA